MMISDSGLLFRATL